MTLASFPFASCEPASDWREIPLSKGFVTIVDAADYEWLSQWKWHAHVTGRVAKRVYAVRNASREERRNGAACSIRMHREIHGPTDVLVDHINRNTLDNRRANLREATPMQNRANSERRPSAAIYRGVWFDKRRNVFIVRIGPAHAYENLGTYLDGEDAARVYDAAAIARHGQFAALNFPGEEEISIARASAAVQAKDARPSRRGRNRKGKSGYWGVTPHRGRWAARIQPASGPVFLGVFDDPADAARAYDRAAVELRGPLAVLNFPEDHDA